MDFVIAAVPLACGTDEGAGVEDSALMVDPNGSYDDRCTRLPCQIADSVPEKWVVGLKRRGRLWPDDEIRVLHGRKRILAERYEVLQFSPEVVLGPVLGIAHGKVGLEKNGRVICRQRRRFDPAADLQDKRRSYGGEQKHP